MMHWQQFAEDFIHPQAVEIVEEAEILRVEGQIGSCVMRQVAVMWHDMVDCTVSSSMSSVANEAYRYLALKYIRGEK